MSDFLVLNKSDIFPCSWGDAAEEHTHTLLQKMYIFVPLVLIPMTILAPNMI